MSTYRAFPAHDTALGSLTVLDPQPRSAGVQVTQRTYGASGEITDQGLYVELVYDVLQDSAEVIDVLTDFGLHAQKAVPVTIYARNDLYQWKRFNGYAVRPAASWDRYRPRNIVILIRDLEELA